jgi:hypothetical protein
MTITANEREIFEALVAACEKDCMNEHTEGPVSRDDDDASVAIGDMGESALTFGHIRRARAAISAAALAAPEAPEAFIQARKMTPQELAAVSFAQTQGDISLLRQSEVNQVVRDTMHRIAAPEAPREPSDMGNPITGWKLVPVEPTETMLDAGLANAIPVCPSRSMATVYRAMLSAAPPAPAGDGWSNAELVRLLRRYRTETPLGHQPHMIAHEVDAALAAFAALRAEADRIEKGGAAASASAQWRPDPAELLRFAARIIGGNSHHCHWLNAVGYRSDPLDQALVNHVLKGAADSLEWLAQNPDKARGMMEYRLERQADHAEEG